MSTTYEVLFEPLSLDGSNYSSWSAHILNVLRTMGPSFEQIVEESILPNDFDNLFKLSNEEMKCLIKNRRVVNLLFKNMDRELSDLIHEDDKLKRKFDSCHYNSREIGFHVENHATQWHGFQHEIKFQEIGVAWLDPTDP